MTITKLTIVAPVFNEEAVIAQFHLRVSATLSTLQDVDSQIIYVVDKCTDNTLEVLRCIAKDDSRVKVLAMSSRFGHQMSLLAGIEQALEADAIVMMDSDLQHPPELIPVLIKNFLEGADVVYTVRSDTLDVNPIRKALGNLFYKFLNRLSDVEINPNAADFRLISRRVAKILAEGFAERNMFLRGLFSWIGFKQVGIEYVAEKRAAGVSKYSFSRMVQLAISGILSFSTKPLQIGIFVGISFSVVACLLMFATLFTFMFDRSLPSGWTTIVMLLLLFNGIQLFVIGVLGVYLGGIYEEVKSRPRYILEEEISYRE
ncbi:glycosyltransferase family 2 protein [Pseudomonas fluorescens]|uniref:glycosyltransferase family 2 protein n=1 Tax=Pseudomonas fluorescens TaxID=294 RepID=UPI0007D08854|nr:glycosyltransferase family 2 protein [Pseudomonas fluorescens]